TIFGRETLVSRSDSLSLVRRLLFLRSPRAFDASSIESIEWLADDPTRKVTVNGRRIPQPAIAIVTTAGTIRCASGISEAEAGEVIATLKQRLAVSWRRRE